MIPPGLKGSRFKGSKNKIKIRLVKRSPQGLWSVFNRLLGNREAESVSELQRDFGEADLMLKTFDKVKKIINDLIFHIS
jgi:hypothetical protein